MIRKITGLQMYFSSATTNSPNEKEFYSRCEGGPLYLWSFEKSSKRWRFLRLRLSNGSDKALCTASWDMVPPTLQTSLRGHYLE
jgi:hypothetical protein